jgi:hypothetical protein
MSIEPQDSALGPQISADESSIMITQARASNKRDITMPQVQERRQEGHLVHLAAVDTSKTDTTTRGNFGNHHLFCISTGLGRVTQAFMTYIVHMGPLRQLKLVGEVG